MKKAFRSAASCAAALCVGALTPLVISGTAGATTAPSRVALHGELPTVPSGVTRLGPVPASQVLKLDVGLAGQDPTGLSDAVRAVSTPGSPDYHHFLTSSQFAAAFGPSAAEVAQVSSSLRARKA